MKNILITGKNSFIGDNFTNYINQYENYKVTIVDTIYDEWQKIDFSKFDIVFHVAGLAHDTAKNKNDELYFKVNCDLALEVARKAKKASVKQFIFMSSILIYNNCKTSIITKDTIPLAKGSYAKSKLKADLLLQELSSETFKIAIMRPPMIFGPKCKGNFPQLIKFANKTFIFPKYKNKRSMLYIDNFNLFLKNTIDNNTSGVLFPQNPQYFCTSEIIKTIADFNGKKIFMPKVINPFIKIVTKFSTTINKVFGDLIYDIDSENTDFIGNNESVKRTLEANI